MLVRLIPEQISKFWNIIRYAVEQSLPPVHGESPNKMNKILMSALDGSVDVWASFKRGKDGNKFEGIVLTEILVDRPSKTKNLLIYCLYGYNDITSESWKTGLNSILKYAHKHGCSQIIGYTDVPSVVEFVKLMGGEARYTFISFDIGKLIK